MTPDIKTWTKKGNSMDFLKALFNDKPLTFDELVQAINAHNGNEANKDNQIKVGNLGGGEYVSKLKYDDIVQQLSGKQTEIDKANGLIADLQKGTKGNEELQGKITAYEKQVADLQRENAEIKVKSALKVALLSEDCTDVDYASYVIERDLKEQGKALELDENEKIKGWDDLISGTKTKIPAHFKDGKQTRKVLDGGKLPGGNTDPQTVTKEQFLKMGYNDRLKLKEENPELFKQLANN